jgi:CheY-like chemotaxis protein
MAKYQGVRHPCERVLAVEDDVDLLAAIGEFLRGEGIEAVLCATAGEAVAALEHGPLPDVMLVDVGLGGTSGPELLARVRSHPRWGRIPLAAMSGSPAGRYAYLPPVDEYLEKPFELDGLNETLSALCRKRGSKTPAPIAPR